MSPQAVVGGRMSVLYQLKSNGLISPAYLALQQELHARPEGYGGKGDKWAAAVRGLIVQFDAHSVLDYGAGQGRLAADLRADAMPGLRIEEFDPAVAGKEHAPGFADLVVCTDVLEHIEPDKLDTVLEVLRTLARKAVFVVIATRPSNKTMRDGRNAHLILESGDWWQARIEAAGFTVQPDAPRSPLKKPSREWVAVLHP